MTHQDETNSEPCWTMVTFTCIFVLITLVLTGLSTAFISMSLLSNYWEHVTYNEQKMEVIAASQNHTLKRIGDKLFLLETGTSSQTNNITEQDEEEAPAFVYLIAAHGGVNALCADVTDEDRQRVKENGVILEPCISYLSNDSILSKDPWLDRMRNLAMSCSIVSLILLGSSAPLGLLGLIKKQISTIMVTGVMYILAAVFGIFTLAFMYFKRVKPDNYFTNTILDDNIPEEYLKTREFSVGWPSSMGWAGLSLCLTASVFWLLLAKILRFQVLSPT